MDSNVLDWAFRIYVYFVRVSEINAIATTTAQTSKGKKKKK